MLIFSKYKYLHVTIASLANVKSCITVGPILLMANVWPCLVPVDYLSGIALTEDTGITVSSCGVKLQEILSGLEKQKLKALEIHMHFCGFSQHYFFVFISLGV